MKWKLKQKDYNFVDHVTIIWNGNTFWSGCKLDSSSMESRYIDDFELALIADCICN